MTLLFHSNRNKCNIARSTLSFETRFQSSNCWKFYRGNSLFFFKKNYFIPFKLAFLCFAIFFSSFGFVAVAVGEALRWIQTWLNRYSVYLVIGLLQWSALQTSASAHTIFAVCTNVCWVHSPAIFQRVLLTVSNLETDSNWVNYPVFFFPFRASYFILYFTYFLKFDGHYLTLYFANHATNNSSSFIQNIYIGY
jgi:hypothetical protein